MVALNLIQIKSRIIDLYRQKGAWDAPYATMPDRVGQLIDFEIKKICAEDGVCQLSVISCFGNFSIVTVFLFGRKKTSKKKIYRFYK
ncbi:hypothetical protein PN36_30495 [Candidatus Thiomargarita nelsonii]|uniref:Uncharacterized protein n=1 Tax=Candidatus Thiomargarita nelsonii TaxID=1003181 RepID=A0A4E0QKY6_9GAMM|nr:hypothetical protein PN36_30495 [Candidatus Thiomargarita nelsonii]